MPAWTNSVDPMLFVPSIIILQFALAKKDSPVNRRTKQSDVRQLLMNAMEMNFVQPMLFVFLHQRESTFAEMLARNTFAEKMPFVLLLLTSRNVHADPVLLETHSIDVRYQMNVNLTRIVTMTVSADQILQAHESVSSLVSIQNALLMLPVLVEITKLTVFVHKVTLEIPMMLR